MEYNETLLTIAEIAVALAGFAGLVSLLGRGASGQPSTIDAARFRTMLEVAFRTAAMAILPLPFIQGAPPDVVVWRILSGVCLLELTVYVFLTYRRYVGVEEVFRDRWVNISLPSCALVFIVLHAVNVLGLAGAHAYSVYLASLLTGLATAAVAFLAVAGAVVGARRD